MGCQQSTPVREPVTAPPPASPAVDLTNKSLSTIGEALNEDTAEKWAATVQRVKSAVIQEETPHVAVGIPLVEVEVTRELSTKSETDRPTPIELVPAPATSDRIEATEEADDFLEAEDVDDNVERVESSGAADEEVAENDRALATIGDALAEDVADKWAALANQAADSDLVEIAAEADDIPEAEDVDGIVAQVEASSEATDEVLAENDRALAAISDALAEDVADKWATLAHQTAEANQDPAHPPAEVIIENEVEMEVIMIAPLESVVKIDIITEEDEAVEAADVEDAAGNAGESNEDVPAGTEHFIVEDNTPMADTVVEDDNNPMVEAAVATCEVEIIAPSDTNDVAADDAEAPAHVATIAPTPISRSVDQKEYILDELIGSTVPVHTRQVATEVVDDIIASAVKSTAAKEAIEVDIDAEIEASVQQELQQVEQSLAEIVEGIEELSSNEFVGDEIVPEMVPAYSDATTAEPEDESASIAKQPLSKSKIYKSLGSVVDNGIVWYKVQTPTGSVVQKRYNDFKILYHHMAHVMVVNDVHGGGGLPPLPRAGMMSRFTRQNKAMIEEREHAFEVMLNAIAEHPFAGRSPEFLCFLQ
ncbi:hypothetical protein ACHHYP_03866 [Achlya hypogyna]|uniref:PX domain-containing protein n=1 Tax=Achlya hypogyna TaxID=1202772 RepID=A0A1V9Z2L1_ACHHY|nr:hypothetical protein ACHHYP_03866 [Achlya hypogyna]